MFKPVFPHDIFLTRTLMAIFSGAHNGSFRWNICSEDLYSPQISVREMSSRAFLINAFCFRRDKNYVLGTKKGQLGFSERQ